MIFYRLNSAVARAISFLRGILKRRGPLSSFNLHGHLGNVFGRPATSQMGFTAIGLAYYLMKWPEVFTVELQTCTKNVIYLAEAASPQKDLHPENGFNSGKYGWHEIR